MDRLPGVHQAQMHSLMHHHHPPDSDAIADVVGRIFSAGVSRIERVKEGVSTWVYRLFYQHETFYLRILPEVGASFAPEMAVHERLLLRHVKVPEIVYFAHCDETIGRSVMLTTAIKGSSLSESASLSQEALTAIVREAGSDLARINSVNVDGFGWIERARDSADLRAPWRTQRAFALACWDDDIAYLRQHVLRPEEVTQLEEARSRFDPWLDSAQGYLAHGDFDTTHIYHDQGHYSGMIDFGEICGADRWYDLGHFHLHDGEWLPDRLLSALLGGYAAVTPLPPDCEARLRFASVVINIRQLSLILQKRPPNRFTRHQLGRLREDLLLLLSETSSPST